MPPTTSPTTPPLIPDYELLRPIGRGSYGEVWLARSVTGVFRVIKVVRRDRFEDERPYLRELEGISRFQAAASGRPRQLALLHVGRNDAEGYFYYVMEPADDAEAGSAIDPDRYVPLTLKELFARRGRLPATECIQLALELARGLAILHGANLIHRDIKPSNIIFVQRVPKLADVGLVASSEATMTCAGTPGYAPREGAGTVAADIFSLGKVLYEIATGLDRMEYPKLPADIADGPDALLLREINSIVLRACHHDPEQRHTSAEALARDLEIVQAGRSVALYEALRKKLKAIAIAAALVAVLAGSGAAMLVWRSRVLSAANHKTRLALYRSDISIAQLARSGGDLGGARAALQRQIPKPGETDLRGPEWNILAYAVRGEGTPLESASSGAAVQQIVTDPSGRWAAASFADDHAAIWDLTTLKITRRLDNVRVLGGFTQDGLLLVDETNRALRYESPTQGTIRRWETGQRLGALLPDGRVLVVSPTGDFSLRILDPESQRTLVDINISQTLPTYETSAIGASKDGKTVTLALYRYNGATRERIITTIETSTSRIKWQRSVPSSVNWIEVSPDSRNFAANYGGVAAVIGDVNVDTDPVYLSGHLARVQGAAFANEKDLVATASADQTIRVWNLRTGEMLSSHDGLGRPASCITWISNSTALIAGDDQGNVRLFPYPANKTANSVGGLFADVHGDFTFSPDGLLVAVSSTSTNIQILRTSNLTTSATISNVFQPILITSDSKEMYALSAEWTLHRCDLGTGRTTALTNLVPDSIAVTGFTVAADRTKMAFSGEGGEIVYIDVPTSSRWMRQDSSSNSLWGLAFSTDGKELWTGSTLGTICSWRTSDGVKTQEIDSLHGELAALSISSNHRWLAAGRFEDSSIRVFDLQQRTWLRPLRSHRRFIQTILFTADDRRLMSGGADGKVVIWRVPEFEEVAAFEVESTPIRAGDEGIAILQHEPVKGVLGALTDDGRLHLWRTSLE